MKRGVSFGHHLEVWGRVLDYVNRSTLSMVPVVGIGKHGNG
jgi:hypothetical protein